jgi:excisionase family DNA binding protein
MTIGCRTLSVPEAGKLYYGLSRNGSYDAAKRGEIPTIRVGRQYRVPIVAMERLMENVTPKPTVGT